MKFLILTALEGAERQEVVKFLKNRSVVYHPITKTDYYVGDIEVDNINYEVAVARTDQTNVNAGIETERAISHFEPDYVFFVGIAGGLKDVSIGDIVIAKDVYGYERGKAVHGKFLPRPNFAFSSYEMERLATNYSNSDQWYEIRKTIYLKPFSDFISVITGTIAAGEKVDSSEESELHIFLKVNCSHAVAIEMEGLGFLEVCRHHPKLKSLLIRGISDLVENKSNSDKLGSQNYASQNAAHFTFGLIKHLIALEKSSNTKHQGNFEVKPMLLRAARELYPEGLKDKSIWERSGGELSRISLNGLNGRTQWFEAFKSIDQGGGGNITYNSLLKEMMEDFHNSSKLIEIDKMLK